MEEPGQRATILIVEDDPDLRLVHSEILSHEGYTVLSGPTASRHSSSSNMKAHQR